MQNKPWRTSYSEVIYDVQACQGLSGINCSYIPGHRGSLNIPRAIQLYFGSYNRRMKEGNNGRAYVPASRSRATENPAQRSFQQRDYVYSQKEKSRGKAGLSLPSVLLAKTHFFSKPALQFTVTSLP